MSKNPFTAVAVAGLALVLLAPAAGAADGNPNCAAIQDSAVAAPEWLAECRPAEAAEPQAGPGRVPGDIIYYVSNFSTNAALARRLLTAPIPTVTYTNVAPCGANPLNIFAIDFDLQGQVLWGIDSACSTGVCTGRSLGTIDQATGVFTVTAQITGPPTGSNFAGMKFDPTTSNVYIAVISGTSSSIWTLNLQTGVATPIGTPTPNALWIDIAIDNSGQMYAHEIINDNLWRVDKTTGVPTLVGPTGAAANFAQGMDVDPSDNTMYAFVISAVGISSLRTVNTTTGAFTQVVANGEELEGAVKLSYAAALEPMALAVDAAGNNVLQPNEGQVAVQPSWRNPNPSAIPNVTGTLANFTGPAGPLYSLGDGVGAYGSIGASATVQCTDCYTVGLTAGSRPAAHWDTTARETVTGNAIKNWTLHVGDSFTDVPASNLFYRFIETILHKSVTGGCTPTTYCPVAETNREQLAVFVLAAKEGPAYQPAACGATPMFSDVPVTSPFCRWIEELARRQVVTGCGTGIYCPTAPALRDQMAVFVLKTLDPAINPPACVAGSELFTDVPASSGFCRWVEELSRRGVVAGCGGGAYCPSASVTREQMSVFLSAGFSLTLYGV